MIPVMKHMILKKEILHVDKCKEVSEAPKKLDPSKWVDSYLALENFLRTQVSADGKHILDYAIQKDKSIRWVPSASHDDPLKFNAPLAVPQFNRDNHTIYRITKQWTLCKLVPCRLPRGLDLSTTQRLVVGLHRCDEKSLQRRPR
jgi:hypothetical protein